MFQMTDLRTEIETVIVRGDTEIEKTESQTKKKNPRRRTEIETGTETETGTNIAQKMM